MKINNLRSFIYLNSTLVQDYLSQLEKGHYASEHIKDTNSERTVEQNDNSEFERLYSNLQGAGLEKSLIETDDDWDAVEAGEVIEIDVNVSMNMLNSLLSNPIVKALMLNQIKDTDPKTVDYLIGNDIAVTAKLANSSKYSFLMNLPTASVRLPNELNGELTMLCKVHRKLKKEEKQAVLSFPGIVKSALSKDNALEDLRKSFTDQGLEAGELEISAPGAILTPIAIYR